MANPTGDCRFYEERFPRPDDLVMVKVKHITAVGAYVSLCEYNEMEGMILMSELTKRRIRSLSKLVRVGKLEVVMVLRVDTEKGYIDLSKRRVSPEDIAVCEEKFSKSKAVQTIMRHVAQNHECTLFELNEKIAWPLYKKYGHAYDAFREMVTNPEAVLAEVGEIDPRIKASLVQDCTRRLTGTALKIRALIECYCYEYEGVDAVKAALLKGQDFATERVDIKIKLISPPQYVVLASCMDKEEGMKKVKVALAAIEEELIAKKGMYKLKAEPTVVGGDDDKLLERLNEDDEEEESDDEEEEQDETMGAAPDIPEGIVEESDEEKEKPKE